jgi:hypothetical protein
MIDAWSAAAYRSAKYQFQISDGSKYEMGTISLIHDGTTVYMTTYGNVWSNSTMGDFDATLVSGTVTLTYTANVSNSKTIKYIRFLISP